jgi:hypothetical protein
VLRREEAGLVSHSLESRSNLVLQTEPAVYKAFLDHLLEMVIGEQNQEASYVQGQIGIASEMYESCGL